MLSGVLSSDVGAGPRSCSGVALCLGAVCTSLTRGVWTGIGSRAASASSIGSGCVTSVFSSSGIMISSISGISETSDCAAITAGGVGSTDVSTAGSFCGHIAAHRARQAANAVEVMIRFFILFLPFRTWKERPTSSLYSERTNALFRIDSVLRRSATPAQIQR